MAQWQVPITQNEEFNVTETVPGNINVHPAPTGTYMLSTALNNWGDSTELLQGNVSVFKPH